jgi:hypothetical protein
MVDVMVKEIAEVRNEPAGKRIVVVRSKEGAELGIGIEDCTDLPKGITMHLDIRVKKDEEVACCTACSLVTSRCRAQSRRFIDQDDLLRSVDRVVHRSEAPLHGLPPVRGWYHHRDRMHRLILGREALHPGPARTCAPSYNPTEQGSEV